MVSVYNFNVMHVSDQTNVVSAIGAFDTQVLQLKYMLKPLNSNINNDKIKKILDNNKKICYYIQVRNICRYGGIGRRTRLKI